MKIKILNLNIKVLQTSRLIAFEFNFINIVLYQKLFYAYCFPVKWYFKCIIVIIDNFKNVSSFSSFKRRYSFIHFCIVTFYNFLKLINNTVFSVIFFSKLNFIKSFLCQIFQNPVIPNCKLIPFTHYFFFKSFLIF